jgi:hypothetical protein
MTYASYSKDSDARDLLDPVGASQIVTASESTIDSYDVWWKFNISKEDFMKVATITARIHDGPRPIEFHTGNAFPESWDPDASPDWWQPSDEKNSQAIYWCDKDCAGWFLAFNRETKTAWAWYWWHQYACEVCNDE